MSRADGEPVTDLQPYLGAYGHLVALRDGDLAYLHVHPDGSPATARPSPDRTCVFDAEVPSAGATGCSSTSSTAAWCAPRTFAVDADAAEDRCTMSHGPTDPTSSSPSPG